MNRRRPLAALAATTVLVFSVACGGLGFTWNDRAANVLNSACQGAEAQELAQLIKLGTHPFAVGTNMDRCEARVSGGEVVATYTVGSRVLFSGEPFVTVVEWRFDRQGHQSAVVIEDGGPNGAGPFAEQAIDQFFGENLYPEVARAADGDIELTIPEVNITIER